MFLALAAAAVLQQQQQQPTPRWLGRRRALGVFLAVPQCASATSDDVVVRVIDANTVKLEKLGTVRLAGVRLPEYGGYPDCFDRAPDARTRLLLPRRTRCRVAIVKDDKRPTVEIFASGSASVNEQLVRDGYALAVRGSSLKEAEAAARADRRGIWDDCSRREQLTAVFEEIDLPPEAPKPNPGDAKNCADFETYEDAKRFFDAYFDLYGDVANLDRDGDGIPCPRLPHTSDAVRFQFKRPSRQDKAR
ncbi:hypothetical protein CTAYLR_007686 [Chrysophaeum taylorii]|uniref:TNase-like domain-containing protein n=1 Tax=Chrysophaeum taylorii TaxID=2483200 RepID=A0AAD7U647_9STRA|nr:hypothetical protein CTAYLR_007686 [Chrysophaeum taylorii]